MIKNLTYQEYGNFIYSIKGTYEKPIANILFKVEDGMLSPKTREKTRISILATFIQLFCATGSNQGNQARKKPFRWEMKK